MRLAEKTRQTIYYASPAGKQEVLDSNGYRTGDFDYAYTTPQPLDIHVSEARRTAEDMPYGVITRYTRTLIAEPGCPLNELDVLWIGRGTDQPHNYTVVQKSDTKNFVSYVIRQEPVSEAH